MEFPKPQQLTQHRHPNKHGERVRGPLLRHSHLALCFYTPKQLSGLNRHSQREEISSTLAYHRRVEYFQPLISRRQAQSLVLTYHPSTRNRHDQHDVFFLKFSLYYYYISDKNAAVSLSADWTLLGEMEVEFLEVLETNLVKYVRTAQQTLLFRFGELA